MFLVNVTRYYGDDQHVQDAQHHDHMYIDVSASHYHMLQLQTNSKHIGGDEHIKLSIKL